MAAAIHIVATGARTPIGLQAAPSAAAVRAGISGLGHHPFMIDQSGDPMPGALDDRLDPGLMGAERLLALAESALREAFAPCNRSGAPSLRVPIYLALPEIRPGFTPDDVKAVQTGMERLAGLPISINEVRVFPQGHAAGLAALEAAVSQMQNGAFEMCLVGGVDSYFHPDTMEWLDENLQLAGAVSRSAFVPGEGAGFCLLMTERARAECSLESMGHFLSVATAIETKLIKTSDICLGEGLTSAVRNAIACLGSSDRINAVICDINSERYRCEEWGFVCLRLSQHFDDPTAYLSPADCWGDMGAASAPLFAMLACQAASRGYADGKTMLWASSEGGLRGAVVLETKNSKTGRAD